MGPRPHRYPLEETILPKRVTSTRTSGPLKGIHSSACSRPGRRCFTSDATAAGVISAKFGGNHARRSPRRRAPFCCCEASGTTRCGPGSLEPDSGAPDGGLTIFGQRRAYAFFARRLRRRRATLGAAFLAAFFAALAP